MRKQQPPEIIGHSHGLSDPALTSAPSKKSHSGISWMGWNCPPRGQLPGQLKNIPSEKLFFHNLFSQPFFFFFFFFFPGLPFYLNFLQQSLSPSFFSLRPPTYASNLPTNPSTSFILPTHPPHTPLGVTLSLASWAFGFRKLRAWKVESLELEELRVWKHKLKNKHPIFFSFLFSILVLVVAIANFRPGPAPRFFFLFCCF